MSYILRNVRPSDLQNWIKNNAPGSLKATARESWRAYLAANGGTGGTIVDQENKFLSAQAGSTLSDKWGNYLSAQTGKKGKEKARNLYK